MKNNVLLTSYPKKYNLENDFEVFYTFKDTAYLFQRNGIIRVYLLEQEDQEIILTDQNMKLNLLTDKDKIITSLSFQKNTQ